MAHLRQSRPDSDFGGGTRVTRGPFRRTAVQQIQHKQDHRGQILATTLAMFQATFFSNLVRSSFLARQKPGKRALHKEGRERTPPPREVTLTLAHTNTLAHTQSLSHTNTRRTPHHSTRGLLPTLKNFALFPHQMAWTLLCLAHKRGRPALWDTRIWVPNQTAGLSWL